MNATTREEPPEGHLLNETEWLTLRALADVIVPPSETYGVPGAGDEAIAKTMVKDADGGRKLEGLIRLLATVGDMAEQAHGAAFYELSEDQRQSVGMALSGGPSGPGDHHRHAGDPVLLPGRPGRAVARHGHAAADAARL